MRCSRAKVARLNTGSGTSGNFGVDCFIGDTKDYPQIMGTRDLNPIGSFAAELAHHIDELVTAMRKDLGVSDTKSPPQIS